LLSQLQSFVCRSLDLELEFNASLVGRITEIRVK